LEGGFGLWLGDNSIVNGKMSTIFHILIGMMGTVFPQEPKLQGRGRHKKGMKKGEEDHLPTDLGIRSVTEEPMRFTYWLVPVGTIDREGGRGKRGERELGSLNESSS
jgi:hypothetical protein